MVIKKSKLQISIANKTIIMVLCTTIALFSVVYFVSDAIFLKSYEEFEKQAVEKNANRVVDALSARLSALDTFTCDWAVWDDTYKFAQDHNQEYIDRNLIGENIFSFGMSLFMILDTSGETVFCMGYDIANLRELPLPEDTRDKMVAQGLVNPTIWNNENSGIMLLSDLPILVVAKPILTSLAEGPSVGTVIIGRFLDSSVLGDLSKTTHLSVTMLPLDYTNFPPDLDTTIKTSNETNPVFIQAQSKDSIAGYSIVNDLNGMPVFVFQVEMPRDIFAQGQKTTQFLQISLIFIGIVFCVVLVILFKEIILSRLLVLSSSVNTIASKGNVSSRVSISGNDELSKLADNINGMLEALEKTEVIFHSQKELITHVLANTPNAILVFSDSESIVLVNKAFSTIFSLDADNMAGKNISDFPTLANLAPEIKRFLSSRALNSEEEFQHGDNGIYKFFISSFSRMKEEDISILVLTDVTEERTRQERLYLTDRLASVGEMASGVAHELNNPLTSIIALSQLLVKQGLPEDSKEDITIINSEAKRCAAIIKNLLAFARQHEAKRQPLHISEIMEDVLQLRAYNQKKQNISVETDFPDDLPHVMADYFQMQQVFFNIILNAEAAMHDANGRGTLRISGEKVNSHLRLSFSDDGPGIPQDTMRYIFDPFFTTKAVGKGTGLGLSISYGIITSHGGEIYAKNNQGKGTTFIVELPAMANER